MNVKEKNQRIWTPRDFPGKNEKKGSLIIDAKDFFGHIMV